MPFAVALLVSAGAAAARDQRVVVFPGSPLTAEMHLTGSNGYAIGVYATGNWVTVSASYGPKSGRLAEATARYEARGIVGKDRIEASFGSFGRISLVFEQKHVRRLQSGLFHCEGGPEVTRTGTFVGTIRFRGEHGYTQVDARRASGQTSAAPRWTCDSPGSGTDTEADTPDQVGLAASCGQDGFGAIGYRSVEQGPPVFPDERSRPTFLASSFETRGRLRVTRLAIAVGGQADFLFDEALSFATVEPPPPFSGNATFVRGPSGGGSWHGSLSVSLPGREVKLVDSRFGITLRRFRRGRVERGYVLPPRSPCGPGSGPAARSLGSLSRILGTVNS